MQSLIRAVAMVFLATGLWSQVGTIPPQNPVPPESKLAPELTDSKTIQAVKIMRALYPTAAERQRVEGEVVVKVHVSETGDVKNTEVVSGDPLLTDAAVNAAKQWKFKPLLRNGIPVEVATNLPFEFVYRDKIPADAANVGLVAWPKLEGLLTVRVSEDAAQEMAVKKVAPEYPPLARVSRIQGSVVLFAIIDKEGNVGDLQLISGHPLLAPAAIVAVKKWRYRPYVLSGHPTDVQTTIRVNFTTG